MEDETTHVKEMFHGTVMGEIRALTAKVEELQTQVASISQTLMDHIDACPRSSNAAAGVRLRATERRRTRRRSEDHKQVCLRKSLQKNIILLVENLPFTESELGDMLISADCLTEDECGDLRRCQAKKDQIRNLVRLIKGRSFKVMTDFLNCVYQISPEIAQRVWDTYQDNLKDPGTQNICTFCNLRHSVDIKLLADHVWSIGAITDGLYDEIVSCDHPTEIHWHKMATECNSTEYSQKAVDIICEALERKGHYKELVVRLRRIKKLECCCFVPEAELTLTVPGQVDTCDDDCNSSVSPNSSVHLDDFERSPLSDISSHEELVDIPYNEILDTAMSFYSNQEEMLQSVRHGFKSFGQRQRGDGRGTNINLLRVRSNSFGRPTARKNSWSQRRASMFN